MTSRKSYIGHVTVAIPDYSVTQEEAAEFLTQNLSERLGRRSLSLMHKLFSHPSIRKRHFAFNSPHDLIDEAPDTRIARFTERSIGLSARAAISALQQAGLTTHDVSCLVVNTCTGYICPGISTYLIEELGLPRDIRAYDLVGSGCGGAIPNLQVAASQLDGSDKVVLSVSVEICSATFQMEDELGLLVSNALFADGAAAAVLWQRPEGFEIVATASRYVPEHRDAIRYIHKNGQLHNQLSTSLPRLLKGPVADVVADVLKPLSLAVPDINHWALHTGGDKIINTVKNELGLAETQVSAARTVLSEYGNMSSPTVWFVLREIMNRGVETGEWCMMLAFGAGLSTHACLLRKT